MVGVEWSYSRNETNENMKQNNNSRGLPRTLVATVRSLVELGMENLKSSRADGTRAMQSYYKGKRDAYVLAVGFMVRMETICGRGQE